MTSLLKCRSVSPLGIRTPLLVPSFSSIGFPFLQSMYDALVPYVDCCLVSAYDIWQSRLRLTTETLPRIVWLDSGGYETKMEMIGDHDADAESTRKSWNADKLKSVVAGLPETDALVLVNLEPDRLATVQDQVSAGADFFRSFPGAGKDLLIKPAPAWENYIMPDGLAPFLPSIVSCADILGITDKELGDSMQQRCTNLIGLRKALDAVAPDFPIHVFGVLDPLTVSIYSLCGADVFDGLSWLRYDFAGGGARCPGQSLFDEPYWQSSEAEVEGAVDRSNVHLLRQLQGELRTLAQDGDVPCLESISGLMGVVEDVLARLTMVELWGN